MRLRAFKGLFDIYRFSLASSTNLGEDIPDLLVGNTTHEERQILAAWMRDELARFASSTESANKEYYQLLRGLEQEDLPNLSAQHPQEISKKFSFLLIIDYAD